MSENNCDIYQKNVGMVVTSSVAISRNSHKQRAPQKCSWCRNHQLKIDLKGHKPFCMYRGCSCDKCRLSTEHRRLKALQTQLQRNQEQDEDHVATQVGVKEGTGVMVSPISMPRDTADSWVRTSRTEGSWDSASFSCSKDNRILQSVFSGRINPIQHATTSIGPSSSVTENVSTNNDDDVYNEDTRLEVRGSPASSRNTRNPRLPPKCSSCRNHELNVDLKGHKRYCMYRNCTCDLCRLTVECQRIKALLMKRRRYRAQDEELLASRMRSSLPTRSTTCDPQELEIVSYNVQRVLK